MINANPQEPYALGDLVLNSAKKNLELRYSLLRHFYKQYEKRKGVFFKPTFFAFTDNVLGDYNQMFETFMYGEALMVAPILGQGQRKDVTFPVGTG